MHEIEVPFGLMNSSLAAELTDNADHCTGGVDAKLQADRIWGQADREHQRPNSGVIVEVEEAAHGLSGDKFALMVDSFFCPNKKGK